MKKVGGFNGKQTTEISEKTTNTSENIRKNKQHLWTYQKMTNIETTNHPWFSGLGFLAFVLETWQLDHAGSMNGSEIKRTNRSQLREIKNLYNDHPISIYMYMLHIIRIQTGSTLLAVTGPGKTYTLAMTTLRVAPNKLPKCSEV